MPRFSLRLIIVTATAAAAGTLPAGAASFSMASHRAIYDLTLDDASVGGDIADVSGRMVMEFTGSACAGYTTKLRFVTESEDSDGQSQVIDSRSDIFETADGNSMRFVNETFTDDALSEESRGSASRKGKDIAVALTKPSTKSFDLPTAIVFPTEQMQALITGAEAGQRFVSLDLYDGSEDGETVFTTAGVIGPEADDKDDTGDEGTIKAAGLGGLRHWPVTISYFNDKKGGDETPYYVMSFIVYENGIGRSLRINYGNFALSGRLTQLDLLPAQPCP